MYKKNTSFEFCFLLQAYTQACVLYNSCGHLSLSVDHVYIHDCSQPNIVSFHPFQAQSGHVCDFLRFYVLFFVENVDFLLFIAVVSAVIDLCLSSLALITICLPLSRLLNFLTL